MFPHSTSLYDFEFVYSYNNSLFEFVYSYNNMGSEFGDSFTLKGICKCYGL